MTKMIVVYVQPWKINYIKIHQKDMKMHSNHQNNIKTLINTHIISKIYCYHDFMCEKWCSTKKLNNYIKIHRMSMKTHQNHWNDAKITNKHAQVCLKTSPTWLEYIGNNCPSCVIIKNLHVDFDVRCYEIDTKMHSNH